MKLLINYSNYLYRKSQKLNSTTGKQVGLFDKVISYSPKDLDKHFYEKNKKILEQSKGNGYWLWKPYFIKKTLEMLNFGDFLSKPIGLIPPLKRLAWWQSNRRHCEYFASKVASLRWSSFST